MRLRRKRKQRSGEESWSSDTRNVTPARNEGRVSVSKPIMGCAARYAHAASTARSSSTTTTSPSNSMAGSWAVSSLLILSVKRFSVLIGE